MTTYARPYFMAVSTSRPATGTGVSNVGRLGRAKGLSAAHFNLLNPGLGPRLGLTA